MTEEDLRPGVLERAIFLRWGHEMGKRISLLYTVFSPCT
jgi:hypothetical protein